MDVSFRIATCNVQNGIGTTRGYWHYLLTGWKYRLPHGSAPILRAAQFLKQERVDVVALCEVGGGARRTRGVDQVALLSEASGLPHRAFFPTLVRGTRVRQGNGVCSRFAVQAAANHALPGTGEPRFLSEAALTLGGTAVRLFVTHLSLQRPLRAPQIDRIAQVMGPCDVPTLLTGDFNVSEEAELDLLLETPLQKVTSAPTFPAWRPRRALDHLFFSRHFTVHAAYAFDAFRFSDHLPLVAEVTLRADGSATTSPPQSCSLTR